MLDVSGPTEVFAEANTLGACYSLRYTSSSGEPVRTSIGTRLPVDAAAAEVDADTLVVPGADPLVTEPIPSDLTEAVRLLRAHTHRLVSICTGSFVLAAAGLLSGHRATTHWRHAQLLARAYPDIRVEPDSLFVEDRGIFTSAGVTAGIDLALSLVERDQGADLARDVARNLVMSMQRPGGQSQFSAPLKGTRREPPPAPSPLIPACCRRRPVRRGGGAQVSEAVVLPSLRIAFLLVRCRGGGRVGVVAHRFVAPVEVGHAVGGRTAGRARARRRADELREEADRIQAELAAAQQEWQEWRSPASGSVCCCPRRLAPGSRTMLRRR